MKKLGFVVMPLMAVSLLASCGGNKEPTKVSYTLTYTYDNGTTDKYVETYDKDKKTEKPTWKPEYANHTFDGWFTKSGKEGDSFTFGNTLTDNTVIYAHWTENPAPALSHKLIYHYDNETTKTYTETYVGDAETVEPTWTPSYDGHAFKGWYENKQGELPDKVFTFGNSLEGEITNIHAHWDEVIPTTYTVTFDAGNGKFPRGEQKLSFKLDSGTKLLPYIKALTPTLEGQTFAYYKYGEENDNAIDYDDVVTSDVTLEANYFPSSTAPTDDLTDFDWKTIKNISVTGDPSLWFNIGATKKVIVNGKDHTVRIIDFNHDYSELPDEGDPDPNKALGITFEFANVITNADGTAVTMDWNNKDGESSTNYDYRESTFNDFLNNTEDDRSVINMLPSNDDPSNPDLRNVIKLVDKKVGVNKSKTEGPQYYTATSFDGETHPYPYLFPLAYYEITSETSPYVPANEGKIYQYYSEHSNQEDRIKRKAGIESENGEDYWLRSPGTDLSRYAYYIYIVGDLRHNLVYNRKRAIAPAFCI